MLSEKDKNRFESSYTKEEFDGCWLWNRAICGGYGKFSVSGKATYNAHRVSYELYIGSIPDKLTISHSCDNKNCVNPKHLYLTSKQEILKRNRR